jgi:hypothetical protein
VSFGDSAAECVFEGRSGVRAHFRISEPEGVHDREEPIRLRRALDEERCSSIERYHAEPPYDVWPTGSGPYDDVNGVHDRI